MLRIARIATFSCLSAWAASAHAQVLNNVDTTVPGNYAGGSGAQVTTRMAATLQRAIELTLVGVPDGAAVTTITNMTASRGLIDFGLFDTQCSFAPLQGQCFRVTGIFPGCYLVSSFRVTVRFSGAASADVGLSRDGPIGGSPPDIANLFLRWAPGLATTWTSWLSGNNVDGVLSASGQANLASAVPSGTSVVHQVGLRFWDSAARGAYTTVVRWTATTN